MNEEIIKAQEDNARTPNYNKWILESILPYVGTRILDVGAGQGNFLPYFLQKEFLLATDILDVFVEKLTVTYSLRTNVKVCKADIQNEEFIEIARRYYVDTVICNNVLEHVQDDQKALRNISAMLPPGGRGNLILVLPAFQILYSRWDRAVGHFRRYDFSDIQSKLQKEGFSIKRSFYMNCIGFFAWFVNGKILHNTPYTGAFIKEQVLLFDRYMVKPLRFMERIIPPAFGQTLVIIAHHTYSPIK
ncbi:MAG: methyltransferase domain-containing protein [Candidatus Omnitrophica bacterium]|nr:methyltransferase domain-containing protein [Candidatus Omnitrophota bacterium]